MKSKKKTMLICLALAVVIAIGVFVVIYTSKETVVIFDGVATVKLPKGMTQTFQRQLGGPNPAVGGNGNSSFFLAAANNQAITRFTITPVGRFVMPTDIKDYLLASKLLPHIDEVKDEKITKRKNGMTISATVINNKAIDYSTYKFVLNVVVGKNYVITSITQIYENNIGSPESEKWISYMSSLKIADDEKIDWAYSGILPEALKQVAMQSTEIPRTSYMLESDTLSLRVELPETFNLLNHSGWGITVMSGDEKYSADLFLSEGNTLETFMVLADYDFYIQKLSMAGYSNVTRSPTQVIVADRGSDTHYFKVHYTYEVEINGSLTQRDCTQIIAGTAIDDGVVYAMTIGSFADEDLGMTEENLIKLLSFYF